MARDFVRSLPEHDRSLSAGWLRSINIDPILLIFISLVIAFGLVILFSAVNQNEALFQAQLVRMGLAFLALVVAAQLPPRLYVRWAPFVYLIGVGLLVMVLLMGVSVKGAQQSS